MAAFTAALDRPACDGLELDVRISADGVPVVCHDPTLERVQRRSERVDSVSAEALERFGVPALADVLEAVGRRPFLDVELKVDAGPALVEVLAAGRGPELHHAVVSSSDPAALDGVARRAPAWRRWLIAPALDAAAVADALALGCRGVAIEWHALDGGAIGRAKAAELEVAAWTVRRRATFERLAELGVVAVCVEAGALDG
jgi:glycerophosphoryl diester phosphodiesterase